MDATTTLKNAEPLPLILILILILTPGVRVVVVSPAFKSIPGAARVWSCLSTQLNAKLHF